MSCTSPVRSTTRTSAPIAIVVLLGLLGAGRADAARYALWASDEFAKVAPDRSGDFPAQTYLWSTTPTDSTITLHGARDEYVACQLVIDAMDDLFGVDVTSGDLSCGSHRIPADSVRLYLEHGMRIASVHPDQPGKASLVPAWYRDALIPFRDPYSPSSPRVAGPFWVQAHTNRVVWVDIHVPLNAPAGLYEGDLIVVENTSAPRRVHVKLTVWNFTLPERTQLVAWAGLHPEYYLPGEEVDPGYAGLNADSWPVLREYNLMAHEHRFTIAHKNIAPWATFNPDGSLAGVDWSRYDQYLGPVIDGSIFPDGKPPACWMLPILCDFRVPFDTAADARAVREWTAEVAAHFQSRGWPLDNAFAWVYDEPRIDTTLNFPEEVIEYAAALRAGSPLVNIMMTEAIEDSALLDAGDWWCSKADKYYPPEMDGLEASGRIGKKMFYQSYAEPSLPVESIDVNGLAWRVWPWVGLRYQVDGILYWAANYWNAATPYDSADGQPESYNDGEGTFFYPGAKLDTQGFPGIRGPVSSFRMKAFRRGLEDCAYVERLRAKGQSARADSIVNAMVPSALCAYHDEAPIHRGGITRYIGPRVDPRWSDRRSEWKQTGDDWWQARRTMGNILSEIGEDSLRVWVLSPNGGEAWDRGSTRTITWITSGGAVAGIDVYLSRDGGVTWSDTLATGTADDGAWTWTVEGGVGDSLRVGIRAHRSGTGATDVSDAAFHIADGIPPACHLVAPDGGELWQQARPETIRWTATDNGVISGIDLDLSPDGGATWPVSIIAGTANDGLHVWDLPASIGDTRFAKVRATAHDGSGLTASDASDAIFSILHDITPPTAELLAPNGGETWTRQEPETIRWVVGNNDTVAGVDLHLSTDGGATWPVTIAMGLADTGRFIWMVPDSIPRTTLARLRVTARDGAGFSASDVSDSSFSVQGFSIRVTSPDGGELWDLGTRHDITWTSDGASTEARANIYLSTDGGATRSQALVYGTLNDGSFPYTVTGTRGSQRTVVVELCDGALCRSDAGNGTFKAVDTLPPVVTVLAPNGGELWNRASPETIRWVATDGDVITDVCLILSHNGGATYTDTIATHVDNDGHGVWTVSMSSPVETDTRIRVLARDGNGHNGYDNGNAVFTTAPPAPDLVVSSRMLQDPASPEELQVYAVTSKEISDTSLTVTVNGAPVVMAPGDSSRNLWRGTWSIAGGGTYPVNACARDWGGFRDCETRNITVTRIMRATGGVARSAGNEATLTLLPLALPRDSWITMGVEAKEAASRAEAWTGAAFTRLYEVGPAGQVLALPATLLVTGPGMSPGRCTLAREVSVDGSWMLVPSTFDLPTGGLLATITRLGRYAVISTSATGVIPEPPPSRSRLDDCRPNPFTVATTVRYALARAGDVRLGVYDSRGRLIRSLVDRAEAPGRHHVEWDGRDTRGAVVPGGVYFYRLETGGVVETRKMVLIR